MSHVSFRPALAVVTGVAVAMVLVLVGMQPASPGSCRPGVKVAQLDTITPWVWVNSPFRGEANGSFTYRTSTNNLSEGYGPAVNGTVLVFSADAAWSISIATGESCSSRFLGSPIYRPGITGVWGWPPYGNLTNDTSEPAVPIWQGGVTNVRANATFYRSTSQITTCGQGGAARNLTSTSMWESIPFNYTTGLTFYNVSIPVIGHYQYYFPANTGTWLIDNLSAPGGPGGGWAFSYYPCS